ncbi:transcriptional regulator [Ruminococcus sp. CAG:403]|nr:transcriptional regulator [Ruminococcus sp. CAG:403]
MTNAELSLQTKKEIAQTLKQFMWEKPFSKITVSEIIRTCNINRKTFYYHFSDIYALLK